MLKKDETKLEIFSFGNEDQDEDNFYCLVNLNKSPEGMDLKKLSQADPRNFDEALNEMGCLLMLRGDELEILIEREEITGDDMHQSIYDLAVKEEIIS